MAPGLRRQPVRRGDDRDGAEEGGLDQTGGFAHWDQLSLSREWMGMDLSIFYDILGIRQCNTDYQYLWIRS